MLRDKMHMMVEKKFMSVGESDGGDRSWLLVRCYEASYYHGWTDETLRFLQVKFKKTICANERDDSLKTFGLKQ